MPIMLVAANWAPSSAWPGMMPMMVSKIGAMITSGKMQERNYVITKSHR
jgi:hypothetical protein